MTKKDSESLESLENGLNLEKEWKSKEKGWKGQLGKLRSKANQLENANSELEAKLESQKNSSKVIPFTHSDLPSWLRKCVGPGCSGNNPNYKEEVTCSSCEGNLGSQDDLDSLDSCPHCDATGDIGVLAVE